MTDCITAGMYAFDDALQDAWRALFQQTAALAPELDLPSSILFTDSAKLSLNPQTRLAHTCGYPLVSLFSDQLRPLCVPCFDVKACEQGQYHSLFLVRSDDPAHSLADCQSYKATINHQDSNSGMNVFRAAVAKIKPAHCETFFASVSRSGSHLNSMTAILTGQADIAAIDVITYDFVSKFKPALSKGLRSIGRSTFTMGLPFVTQMSALNLSSEPLTRALNQALSQSPQATNALNLKGFMPVQLEDYKSIQTLEQYAINKGYPLLI